MMLRFIILGGSFLALATARCTAGCFGVKTCDEIIKNRLHYSYKTCARLEQVFSCNCNGCWCETTTTTSNITTVRVIAENKEKIKSPSWLTMTWIVFVYQILIGLASGFHLVQNLTDRNKHPEGEMFLNSLVYFVVAVVSEIMVISAFEIAKNEDNWDPNSEEFEIGFALSVVPTVMSGTMLFLWPLFVFGTNSIQFATCMTNRKQLVLVKRESPRRFIFGNLEQMRSGGEFYLTLQSHGGASIHFIPPNCIGKEQGIGLMGTQYKYVRLGAAVGEHVTAIKATWDGKWLAFPASSGEEICLDITMGKLFAGNHVNACRHISEGAKQESNARCWKLNDDGSLSPLVAPHLALGDLFSSGLTPESRVVAAAVAVEETDPANLKSLPVAEMEAV